eukprot:TRINITY_DN64995_c0_g1_i2.p1 TRINITY_DN64995_c0_g1~~TRINITY_DN64995_c0_g1_i2.p1  ORF type:complete len:259 (+),score=45.09 TRINITY_DN64995_c0_g1_i2:3-779(+)
MWQLSQSSRDVGSVLAFTPRTSVGFWVFFFFSSRRRHTRCREVSWARRCVQETDQGRDDDRHPVKHQGRKLVTEGFPPAGRHHCENVPPADDLFDDLLLVGAERLVVEVLFQCLLYPFRHEFFGGALSLTLVRAGYSLFLYAPFAVGPGLFEQVLGKVGYQRPVKFLFVPNAGFRKQKSKQSHFRRLNFSDVQDMFKLIVESAVVESTAVYLFSALVDQDHAVDLAGFFGKDLGKIRLDLIQIAVDRVYAVRIIRNIG